MKQGAHQFKSSSEGNSVRINPTGVCNMGANAQNCSRTPGKSDM